MKHRDSKTDDVYMISDRKGWRKTREGQKMTLEMNEEQPGRTCPVAGPGCKAEGPRLGEENGD